MLASNASKHGALSCPAGRVNIAWHLRPADVDTKARLCLTWTETGGPPVATPGHQGFGMRLIRRGLAHELNGDVQIDFHPGGLVCAISIPWTVDEAASRTPQQALVG